MKNGVNTFPYNIFYSFKLKEFADDNFKFDENSRKFSKWVENNVGKRKIAAFPSVFKRDVLKTCKNKGFIGKWLIYLQKVYVNLCSPFNPFPNDKL